MGSPLGAILGSTETPHVPGYPYENLWRRERRALRELYDDPLASREYQTFMSGLTEALGSTRRSAFDQIDRGLAGGIKLARLGYPDEYVEHGTPQQLLDKYDLNAAGIAAAAGDLLKRR